jgi:hypothetical protein
VAKIGTLKSFSVFSQVIVCALSAGAQGKIISGGPPRSRLRDLSTIPERVPRQNRLCEAARRVALELMGIHAARRARRQREQKPQHPRRRPVALTQASIGPAVTCPENRRGDGQ